MSRSILDMPFEDLMDLIPFGPSFLCTENSTGHHYACKVIHKQWLLKQSGRDEVRREAEIWQYLRGQSYIAEFKDTFEDHHNVFMVMEPSTGGDIYDLLSSEGKYTERVIPSIIRDIVNAVQVCHRNGVMHRNINTESFLLSSKD